jgi:hypothetical protein
VNLVIYLLIDQSIDSSDLPHLNRSEVENIVVVLGLKVGPVAYVMLSSRSTFWKK